MADTSALIDQEQESIHFDALWSTVQDAIAVYGGKWWSERGEHDPGITLLQAISFAVSDLAYRHTLPLKDLLTPKSLWQAEPRLAEDKSITNLDHEGRIFAPEFGPDWALTCGPVTLNDYRRAVLDLKTDEGVFCFRDVQIAPLDSKLQYAYTYDEQHYSFRFVSERMTKSDIRRVAGGYQMWVTINAEVTEDDARGVLEPFLRANRNLCEREITDITVVERVPLISTESDFKMVLELDDDTPGAAVAEVIAEVMLVADDWLLPRVERSTAQRRLAQGEPAEAIYDGPRLTNGWIERVPPVFLSADGVFPARKLSLQDLKLAVMGVRNVKSVQWVRRNDQALSPATLHVNGNQHAYLWLTSDDELDSAWKDSFLLRKHGQPISCTSDEVETELSAKLAARREVEKQVMQAKERAVPAGRYRHPGYYQTAGGLLPPVYGLQQEAERLEPSASQLIQFLRPFEQMLADTADQLEQLPKLLAFDGREQDARVWGGANWPKPNEDPLASDQNNHVLGKKRDHDSVLNHLNEQLQRSAKDGEKELAILNYLLGYFGEQRAARTLLATADTEFRWVQQGFLRQITRLGYERAAISISKISALQRRIAARLGIGSMLFDERLQKSKASLPSDIPFFVIENHELLPASPPSDQLTDQLKEPWPKEQTLQGTPKRATPSTGRDQGKDILTMTLSGGAAKSLQVGQLIEIQQFNTQNEPDKHVRHEPISAVVIHGVTSHDMQSATVTIDLGENARLARSFNTLKVAGTTWRWRYSATWLTRVIYDLQYKTPPNPLTVAQVTLKVGPSFPVGIKLGDQFVCRPKARWQILSTQNDIDKVKNLPDIVVEVVRADEIQGTVEVKWVGSGIFPTTAGGVSTVNNIDDAKLKSEPVNWPPVADASKYGWAVPYRDETFAFTLSVVLNRQWLEGQGNSAELNQWIEQIVREEVPSHLVTQIHWLDADKFGTFAKEYQTWQDNDRPVGDRSFSLLSFLGVGMRPADTRTGIGFVQVAGLTEANELEMSVKSKPDDYPNAYVNAQVVYIAKPDTPTPSTSEPK